MSESATETSAAATSARPDGETLWQRAQRGWPARFPIAQFPNPPLIVAATGWLVAAAATGSVHDYARGTFYVALGAWAWLELTGGANWVRRAIGGAGLVYVVAKVGEALGG